MWFSFASVFFFTQKENAQKTESNAIKREAKKQTQKPRYQRAYKSYANYNKEELEKVINNPKSHELEKAAASDLLAKLEQK